MTVGSAPAMAERVRIAPDTTVGPVHLTVADLERSLDYYTGAIGMRIIRGGDLMSRPASPCLGANQWGGAEVEGGFGEHGRENVPGALPSSTFQGHSVDARNLNPDGSDPFH